MWQLPVETALVEVWQLVVKIFFCSEENVRSRRSLVPTTLPETTCSLGNLQMRQLEIRQLDVESIRNQDKPPVIETTYKSTSPYVLGIKSINILYLSRLVDILLLMCGQILDKYSKTEQITQLTTYRGYQR